MSPDQYKSGTTSSTNFNGSTSIPIEFSREAELSEQERYEFKKAKIDIEYYKAENKHLLEEIEYYRTLEF